MPFSKGGPAGGAIRRSRGQRPHSPEGQIPPQGEMSRSDKRGAVREDPTDIFAAVRLKVS